MKIKAEYLGKTLTKSDSVLGKIVLKVDESCIEKRAQLMAMGFDFIFEAEKHRPVVKEPVDSIEQKLDAIEEGLEELNETLDAIEEEIAGTKRRRKKKK